MNKKYFEKRIYNISNFRRDIDLIINDRSAVRMAFQRKLINRAFKERIMLAVTQVNGCRYCSFAHTRQALEAGVPVEHIRQLASGEWKNLPEDELIALNYAQHYAESRGNPDDAAWQKLIQFYGIDGARDILAFIQMITVTNLMGNTFDAFWSRFIGKPSQYSSIWQELGVLLGCVVIIPIAILHRILIPAQPRG